MHVGAKYLRLLHTDVSPKSKKKKNCTASDPSVDTSFRSSALSKVVGEAVKLWGLRYCRVLVSPALELLKHRRCDLSLEGIRGCDERMVRYLVDDSKKERFMDTKGLTYGALMSSRIAINAASWHIAAISAPEHPLV